MLPSKSRKISEKTKIRHRNELNSTLAQLPLSAKRVLCLSFVSIDSKNTLDVDTVFRVNADDFSKFTGVDISVAYKQMKEGAAILESSKLHLNGQDIIDLSQELGLPYNEKNRPTKLNLSITDFCAYFDNEAYVELKFTQTIQPYISNLIGTQNKFTTLLLQSALKLSGKYSYSLYQLIRKRYSKFKGSNEFEISLNDLKHELVAWDEGENGEILYKYPEYPIFRREVLNKAIKEIVEKTEIKKLSFEVSGKQGRRVSELRFRFIIFENATNDELLDLLGSDGE